MADEPRIGEPSLEGDADDAQLKHQGRGRGRARMSTLTTDGQPRPRTEERDDSTERGKRPSTNPQSSPASSGHKRARELDDDVQTEKEEPEESGRVYEEESEADEQPKEEENDGEDKRIIDLPPPPPLPPAKQTVTQKELKPKSAKPVQQQQQQQIKKSVKRSTAGDVHTSAQQQQQQPRQDKKEPVEPAIKLPEHPREYDKDRERERDRAPVYDKYDRYHDHRRDKYYDYDRTRDHDDERNRDRRDDREKDMRGRRDDWRDDKGQRDDYDRERDRKDVPRHNPRFDHIGYPNGVSPNFRGKHPKVFGASRGGAVTARGGKSNFTAKKQNNVGGSNFSSYNQPNGRTVIKPKSPIVHQSDTIPPPEFAVPQHLTMPMIAPQMCCCHICSTHRSFYTEMQSRKQMPTSMSMPMIMPMQWQNESNVH